MYFVRRLDKECHRLDTDQDRRRALVMVGVDSAAFPTKVIKFSGRLTNKNKLRF